MIETIFDFMSKRFGQERKKQHLLDVIDWTLAELDQIKHVPISEEEPADNTNLDQVAIKLLEAEAWLKRH